MYLVCTKNLVHLVHSLNVPGFLVHFQILKDHFLCCDKIMKDFVEFNANGSGWILSRVRLISIHMHLIPGINLDDVENSDIDDEI